LTEIGKPGPRLHIAGVKTSLTIPAFRENGKRDPLSHYSPVVSWRPRETENRPENAPAFEAPQRSPREQRMSGRAKQGGNARDERQRRLAEALRLNLRRRKTQERERSAGIEKTADRPERDDKGESD
jgi:hypothetical protein